jgi:hypothetical protein
MGWAREVLKDHHSALGRAIGHGRGHGPVTWRHRAWNAVHALHEIVDAELPPGFRVRLGDAARESWAGHERS